MRTNSEKLDQCISVYLRGRAGLCRPFKGIPSLGYCSAPSLTVGFLPYTTSASHGASLSLSIIIWRTRTSTTAIEYIQQAASKINIAQSIDGAILKLRAVIVAP